MGLEHQVGDELVDEEGTAWQVTEISADDVSWTEVPSKVGCYYYMQA